MDLADTLAMLAREAAEDIFDSQTADDPEPEPIPERNTTMIYDYDHDDHDHGPPLDPATRNAVLDAGQAALGRRQADVSAELRTALARVSAQLATVTAERDAALETSGARLASGILAANQARDMERRALAAEAERDAALNELGNIARADPSKWEPDMRDQFREWAQSRARHALAALPAVTAPDAGAVWGTEAPGENGMHWAVQCNGAGRYALAIAWRRDGGVWFNANGEFVGADNAFALFGPPVTPPPGWREALAALAAAPDAGGGA